MFSTIEIAHNEELQHISTLVESLGINENDFEYYGKYTGKVRLEILDKLSTQPDGKLILVTAMTPTNHGEGKTVTTIGLGEALAKIGKKAIVAIREPSVGPVFGIKGGATGGGYAQVLPMEKINLDFNGDFSAITTAHNLLAAMLDNHIIKGNELGIDVNNIFWKRAMDMNDRALRNILVGLGGSANGIPRESGFLITAASEVMAIIALSNSRPDLKKRLGEIVLGYTTNKEIVRARDIAASNPMAVILNEAIMPNLVQTIEHTPALIHAGPFGNIAHGTNSILADKIGLKLADYVVTESGFGADLGAEKFFDIVCRTSGFWPSAVVVVATCKAIKYHGGVSQKQESLLQEENMEAFEKGLKNLEAHIRNMKKFNVPIVVTVNQFPYDTPKELNRIREICQENEVEFAPQTVFVNGGEGAIELAEKTIRLADANKNPQPKFMYELNIPIEDKIEKIATEIYGADGIHLEKHAKKKLDNFVKHGYGSLPICIAKTQGSLSDDPKAIGVPKNWNLTVTDVELSAGAGFLVVVCGDMMLMPGLPKYPAAINMDVDESGKITGMF